MHLIVNGVVAVNENRPTGFDNGNDAVGNRAIIGRIFGAAFVLALPELPLFFGKQVFGIWEGRHPSAVLQFCVPAHMVKVEVGS